MVWKIIGFLIDFMISATIFIIAIKYFIRFYEKNQDNKVEITINEEKFHKLREENVAIKVQINRMENKLKRLKEQKASVNQKARIDHFNITSYLIRTKKNIKKLLDD